MIDSSEIVGVLGVVARQLGPLCEKVVFVGGAATSLLITDPLSAAVRPTKDVDVIVEVSSFADYVNLREELVSLGFHEDTEEGAPLCRWVVETFKVDIMPTEESILGFSNRWYAAAMEHALIRTLPGGVSIRLISAPYFLATKLEAFASRGDEDYLASPDLEDVAAVIDGRLELEEELAASEQDLRRYLAQVGQELLNTPAFREAIPGYLPGDPASQLRAPRILACLERIVQTGSGVQ